MKVVFFHTSFWPFVYVFQFSLLHRIDAIGYRITRRVNAFDAFVQPVIVTIVAATVAVFFVCVCRNQTFLAYITTLKDQLFRFLFIPLLVVCVEFEQNIAFRLQNPVIFGLSRWSFRFSFVVFVVVVVVFLCTFFFLFESFSLIPFDCIVIWWSIKTKSFRLQVANENFNRSFEWFTSYYTFSNKSKVYLCFRCCSFFRLHSSEHLHELWAHNFEHLF